MLTDRQSDTVYISDRLEPAHPALVDRLRGILADHGVGLRIIRGTRDIWCRDFMPIGVGPGEYVRFRYAPRYLRGHEHLITDFDRLAPIPEIGTCRRSEIVVDGGNVVGWGGRCILTDRIYRENRGTRRVDLRNELRELLRVDDLIVIPEEDGDLFGHADGMIRFLDGDLVVLNDYSATPSYRRRLTSILRRAGLDWIELPYRPEEATYDGVPSAVGCYANFLMVRGLIIVPTFGLPEDDLVLRIIEEHAGPSAVTSLDCTDLARRGGALNCVTWGLAGLSVNIPDEENYETQPSDDAPKTTRDPALPGVR